MKKQLSELNTFFQQSGGRATAKKVISKLFGEQLQQQKDDSAFFEKLGMIGALDITPEQWEANKAIVENPAFRGSEVRSITWFVPRFEHVLYGGIYTIFRFAEYFQGHGVHNRIVIYDNPAADEQALKKALAAEFPALANADVVALKGDVNELPETDASICTFWTSAFVMHKFTKTKKKFYFVQDYEPLFYSANSYYALTEATYRMGYTGIVNTPGLATWVEQQHGMTVYPFTPSVNHSLYTISEQELVAKCAASERPVKIFLYARPQHERNAFELALATCKLLKARFGDRIDIIAAGDEWDAKTYGVDTVLTNLGRLDSLQKVADLYRTCDIGMVYMFTKHPSYQPFEYMASGMLVATNVNSANTWMLRDRDNAVVMEPIPSLMVERLAEVIENSELRAQIMRAGMQTVAGDRWNDECAKILAAIQAQ